MSYISAQHKTSGLFARGYSVWRNINFEDLNNNNIDIQLSFIEDPMPSYANDKALWVQIRDRGVQNFTDPYIPTFSENFENIDIKRFYRVVVEFNYNYTIVFVIDHEY